MLAYCVCVTSSLSLLKERGKNTQSRVCPRIFLLIPFFVFFAKRVLCVLAVLLSLVVCVVSFHFNSPCRSALFFSLSLSLSLFILSFFFFFFFFFFPIHRFPFPFPLVPLFTSSLPCTGFPLLEGLYIEFVFTFFQVFFRYFYFRLTHCMCHIIHTKGKEKYIYIYIYIQRKY